VLFQARLLRTQYNCFVHETRWFSAARSFILYGRSYFAKSKVETKLRL